MVRFSRSDSRSTMSISCDCSPFSASSWRRIWIEPDIDASGLRISCAMPAAISPTAASRCCRRASRSSRRIVVTSWNVNRSPVRPPDGLERGGADAEVDLAAVRPPVPVVRPPAPRREAAPGRGRPRSPSEAEHVGDRRARRRVPRVAGDGLGRPVERQDAALRSLVTSPIVRLLMM